jgi:hypothetical protein
MLGWSIKASPDTTNIGTKSQEFFLPVYREYLTGAVNHFIKELCPIQFALNP